MQSFHWKRPGPTGLNLFDSWSGAAAPSGLRRTARSTGCSFRHPSAVGSWAVVLRNAARKAAWTAPILLTQPPTIPGVHSILQLPGPNAGRYASLVRSSTCVVYL